MAIDVAAETRQTESRLYGERKEILKPLLLKMGDKRFVLSLDIVRSIPNGPANILQRVARVWDGTDTIRTFDPREKGRFSFGRSPTLGNDVVVAGKDVSRKQAHIMLENGIMYIQDGDGQQGSGNGTYVEEIKPAPTVKKQVSSEEPGYFFDNGSPIAIFLGREKVVYKTNKQGEKVVVTSKGKELPLIPTEGGLYEITLGRDQVFNTGIDDVYVSRTHAKLVLYNNVLEVFDYATENGTYVQAGEEDPIPGNKVKANIKQLRQIVRDRDSGRLAQLRQKMRDAWDRRVNPLRVNNTPPAQDEQYESPFDYVPEVQWNKSELAFDRLNIIRDDSFFEDKEQVTDEPVYQGRRVISRDKPINGGVYLGGSAREAIVVDDSRENSQLLQMYTSFLKDFEKIIAIDPDTLINERLKMLFEFVREKMPYNENNVNHINSQLKPDQKVGLERFLGDGGVCRHQGLFAAYLLEKLITEGKMSGQVSVDRNYVPGLGGHGWARYTAANGEVYIIDAAQQYVGKLREIKPGIQWFYNRPNE